MPYMKKLLLFMVLSFALAIAGAIQSFGASNSAILTITVKPVSNGGGVGSVPFTALHTYFMSPTGNDNNAGTSGSPWLTENHASLVCGDVIIAKTGAYANSQRNITTNPGSCPSASGGIDGNGGVNFVTVLCATPFACTFSPGAGNYGFLIAASNWAFEGWNLTSVGAGCMVASAQASDTTIRHHIAYVNNICANAEAAYHASDYTLNHNVPGNGVDYFAVIGNIAQNSNNNIAVPVSAIDDVGPANFDTNAGTHVLWEGNFAIANLQSGGTATIDGEHMMFDTWDAHQYTGRGIIRNNLLFQSKRMGIQLFDQGFHSAPSLAVKVYNNTLYDDFASGCCGTAVVGDIQVQNSTSWNVSIYKNVGKTILTGNQIYTLATNPGTVAIGGTGIENVLKGAATGCGGGGVCDAGNNAIAFGGASLGTNLYVDPAYKNTADALANHVGAPSCAGFATTAACEGWNFGTQTAAALSLIDDLTATASQAAGKGYRPPAPCITSDADYPIWLKGIIYLAWDGTNLTENQGLITKPCGM